MTEIGIIFFGLSRCISATISSIKRHIYDCNANSGLTLHTVVSLNIPNFIHRVRTNEMGVVLDKEQIFYLEADHYLLSAQKRSDIAHFLAMAQQRGDPFDNNWSSVTNMLHQLLSLQRAWSFCTKILPRKFDYYLFVRPDLEYLDDFPLLEIISAFKGQKNIALPEWHSWGGVNDRFAFADPAAAEIYSDRIEHVLEYCTTTPLHPEVFLKHTLQYSATIWMRSWRQSR